MKFLPDLKISFKLRRLAGWLLLLLVVIWLGFDYYQNWYRVIVNPAPLDQIQTQRRQTAALTDAFERIESEQSRWRNRPELEQPRDIFNAQRITE